MGNARDEAVGIEDDWPIGEPRHFGLDPAILGDMRLRISEGKLDNLHAILIVRKGALLYEQYMSGKDQNGRAAPETVTFDAKTRHNGNSMTKSVISLLIGIAIERRWINALDEPVFSYFPEYDDIRTLAKERVTIRSLLAMSDGLEWFELTPPHNSMEAMHHAPDPYRYVLERDLIVPPGRAFNYNSGSTELLGEILRRATGKTVDILAGEELFSALSIRDVEWNRRLQNGNPMACSALRARPRDWVKFGQLVLNRGVWRGEQIVPSAWIAESTSPQNNGPMQFLYGYQWWLGRSYCHGKPVEWIGAMGWAGQRLLIIPALDMVVLVLAWLPERMNLPESVLLNQYILPAIMDDF